jgi:type IV pilus assembly protein PilA
MKNKKGFTLIELLAVIVVLGIIMLIAVTSVSGVLEKSRKDAFVATARAYISSVRLQISQGTAVNAASATVGLPACGGTENIPLLSSMVEKGGVTSPYNRAYLLANGTTNSYVKVVGGTAVNGVCPYTYSIFLTDGTVKIGTSGSPVAENSLSASSVS